VIGVEPDNTLAIYNRALLRQQTGDYRGAEADYTTLLKAYPNFLFGYAARAECRRKMGNVKGALNDETRVARANLDMTFGKRSRYPVKKVRRESDHNLENYDQLVNTEADDSAGTAVSRILSNELFGRVQNKRTDRQLLPPMALSLRAMPADRTYRPPFFLSEVAHLAEETKQPQLTLRSTTAGEQSATTATAQTTGSRPMRQAARHLIQAVKAADAYNYPEALEWLRLTVKADDATATDTLLCTLQTASIAWRCAAATTTADHNAPAMPATDITCLQALALIKRLTIPASFTAVMAYNTGCLYAAMQNDAEAERAFTQAIEADKDFGEAYYNRGILRLNAERLQEAQADLSMAGQLGLYRAYSIMKQAKKP
ncbi:MAG: tetratricopeptide repeat protein, partial [Alloprevotella sp.]|nr:tetratricopeptide repeat protein [Alloprevotella sp.]